VANDWDRQHWESPEDYVWFQRWAALAPPRPLDRLARLGCPYSLAQLQRLHAKHAWEARQWKREEWEEQEAAAARGRLVVNLRCRDAETVRRMRSETTTLLAEAEQKEALRLLAQVNDANMRVLSTRDLIRLSSHVHRAEILLGQLPEASAGTSGSGEEDYDWSALSLDELAEVRRLRDKARRRRAAE